MSRSKRGLCWAETAAVVPQNNRRKSNRTSRPREFPGVLSRICGDVRDRRAGEPLLNKFIRHAGDADFGLFRNAVEAVERMGFEIKKVGENNSGN